MIANKGDYQIAQNTGQDTVKIFHDGKLIKTLPAKENLSYTELIKILALYTE